MKSYIILQKSQIKKSNVIKFHDLVNYDLVFLNFLKSFDEVKSKNPDCNLHKKALLKLSLFSNVTKVKARCFIVQKYIFKKLLSINCRHLCFSHYQNFTAQTA